MSYIWDTVQLIQAHMRLSIWSFSADFPGQGREGRTGLWRTSHRPWAAKEGHVESNSATQ
jgi:hypothetical protein